MPGILTINHLKLNLLIYTGILYLFWDVTPVSIILFEQKISLFQTSILKISFELLVKFRLYCQKDILALSLQTLDFILFYFIF